jgi:acetoin utilization deacetylase AcuC-like enzyme
MKVFYSPPYVGSAHGFDTTRKARTVAKSLIADPVAGVELAEPKPLTFAQVAEVHDPAYVRAVQSGEPRNLAESQGFSWDPGLWEMVLASNGGVVDAALDALQFGVAGSLSSGLHHARRASGAGFCTFNGLVLGARAALSSGATSVLILDLDAHCGGGTASLISGEPRIQQLDVATNGFDAYESTGQSSLRIVTDPADYLTVIEHELARCAAKAPGFDLCLYNAGVDPYEGCDIGGLAGVTEAMLIERERLVFDWCRHGEIAVAFVLAGGYAGPRLPEATLVKLHRATVATAAAPANPYRFSVLPPL